MEPAVLTEFTPWLSLLGGALIALSAIMVMGLFGKIAGISGITKAFIGLLPGQDAPEDRGWRLSFVFGLILAPVLVLLVSDSFPEQSVPTNLIGMLIAGVLVGIGTTLGSGCTSGHGVCGLARLSPRSLAAVVTFLGVAILTTTLIRHVF